MKLQRSRLWLQQISSSQPEVYKRDEQWVPPYMESMIEALVAAQHEGQDGAWVAAYKYESASDAGESSCLACVGWP